VLYTEEQSVSSDMIGEPYAVIIEGSETHARTGFTRVNLAELGLTELAPEHRQVEIPVTHLKLFGWYDNELGSYTRRMCQLCHFMSDRLG
jgi:glyceraldehyde 3-phosphate dehydrogenase